MKWLPFLLSVCVGGCFMSPTHHPSLPAHDRGTDSSFFSNPGNWQPAFADPSRQPASPLAFVGSHPEFVEVPNPAVPADSRRSAVRKWTFSPDGTFSAQFPFVAILIRIEGRWQADPAGHLELLGKMTYGSENRQFTMTIASVRMLEPTRLTQGDRQPSEDAQVILNQETDRSD